MKKTYFILLSLITLYNNAQNCNNVGFENGTTSGWTFKNANITYLNLPCDSCPNTTGAIATVVSATTSIGTQCANGVDLYGGFPIVAPNGGNHSLLLNNDSAGGKMQQATFTTTVNASNCNFVYQFAAILQKSAHAPSTTPYFSVVVYDVMGHAVLCTKYNSDTNTTITGWQPSSADPNVSCLAWRTVNLDLVSLLGQNATIVFTISDCSQGGHFAYVYLDANCFPNQITANPNLCGSNPATLFGPPGFATYNWTGPATGNSQSLTTSASGNYTLTTTSLGGCPTPNLYYMLAANAAPTVSYTLVQDIAPHTWDAYPTYSSNIAHYSWNWGDGTPLDTNSYPSHVYAIPGKYNICATVTDNNGCSTTYCQNDSVYRLSNSTSSSMVYVNVIHSTTGINQLSNNNSTKIYPNPANNKITIDANDVVDVKLFDVLGKQITTTKTNDVDVSNLTNGVYFIQVQTTKNTTTQKIIIQH